MNDIQDSIHNHNSNHNTYNDNPFEFNCESPVKLCNKNEPLDLYSNPLDGEDPLVWSQNKLMTPYSYMNIQILSNNIMPEAPPPTYLTYS